MRRTLKRTTFFGSRSRAYRCRLERLESRSMMAADIVETAVEIVPDELTLDEPNLDERIEEPAVDAVDGWDGCVLQVCELQELDGWICEFQFVDEPVFIDDSCLIVTEPAVPAFEPVDIRVQFVSSESDSSWAAYYYTVAADGVVQGVSVVASYDEPTIAAFVAEHADDPSVQISDYGDGWWIGGFPLELAPPVPDAYVFSGGDEATWSASPDDASLESWGGEECIGFWSWDESAGAYDWSEGTDGGGDWLSAAPAFVDYRTMYVSSESEPGWAYYTYAVDADGVVQDVTVVASYDEPMIAAFVAEHADDPSVQISDFGDRWYIGGFPVDLAPPVPEYASFSSWGGTSEDALAADGTADLSGSLGVAGGWSWDSWSWDDWCGVYTGDEYEGFAVDGTSTWDGSGVEEDTGWSWSDWTGGDGTVMPLFYARGAIDDDWFVCGLSPGDPPTAAGAAGAGEMQEGDVIAAEPVAATPRAVAFADMGTMAAAATALQSASTDTPSIGGRRRR